MLGSALLTPPSMIVLAGLFSCDPRPPPAIDVDISAEAVQYDLTKSSNDLQSFDIDTISPYSAKDHTRIGGLTGGQINISTETSLNIKKYPVLRKSCVWFDKITIKVTSAPTVYIASEYEKGSCRYRTTIEHEMKHVKTDIDILNEFQPRLEEAARAAVSGAEIEGPIESEDIEAAKSALSQKISEALTLTIQSLQSERRKRQQAIDTREEYDRLSRSCGGQF